MWLVDWLRRRLGAVPRPEPAERDAEEEGAAPADGDELAEDEDGDDPTTYPLW